MKSKDGGKRLLRRISSVHHSRPQLSTKTIKLMAFSLMLSETICHRGASRLRAVSRKTVE